MNKLTPSIKMEIEKIVDKRIREVHVTKEDFTELKNAVEELAKAQAELAKAQVELAKAQKASEVRLTRVEAAVEKLAEVVRQQAIGLNMTRKDLGGLSRSVSYGFENEVFRLLPGVLKRNYGIDIKEKFIRKIILGKEINLLGEGIKDGKDVIIVGEVKLRLERIEDEDGGNIFEDLEERVKVVRSLYKSQEIVKVLIGHIATDEFIQRSKEKGIIVIQSFEL